MVTKQTEKYNPWCWLLDHYIAPACSATKGRKFVAKNKILVIPHPTYSPDLLPSDFFLLHRLNIGLKEGNMMRSPRVTNNLVTPVKCQTTHFTKCFRLWSNCWASCVMSPGGYFDKDTKCCCYGEIYTIHKVDDSTIYAYISIVH